MSKSFSFLVAVVLVVCLVGCTSVQDESAEKENTEAQTGTQSVQSFV